MCQERWDFAGVRVVGPKEDDVSHSERSSDREMALIIFRQDESFGPKLQIAVRELREDHAQRRCQIERIESRPHRM